MMPNPEITINAALDKDAPAREIWNNVLDAGRSTGTHLHFDRAVQLDVEQERRALAVERAARALVDADSGSVLAVAGYVITGRNPLIEGT